MLQALKGINVLDMTEGVAGPYATSLLGDMGASVIKVERPSGDWSRTSGVGITGAISSGFVAINRNKRNIGLDLQRPGAFEIIKKLVARADVLVSNYRTGVMDRLGLGFEACKEINPTIIYCTISAFGQRGPYATQPASDTVMQALSGMMDSIGEPDGPPLRVSFPLIDLKAGCLAVQGVLHALIARLKGHREPVRIDVSLLNAALSLQSLPFARYAFTGEPPARMGDQNPALSPAGSFRTKDGNYITVAVLRQSHWQKFCRAIDRMDLVDDPRFADNGLRLKNRSELNAILSEIFKTKSRDEWIEILSQADVLCAPVYNVGETVNHPELSAGISLLEFEIGGQKFKSVGNSIEVNGAFPGVDIPPCLPGEHTVEILKELGYNDDNIQRFLSEGAVYAYSQETNGPGAEG